MPDVPRLRAFGKASGCLRKLELRIVAFSSVTLLSEGPWDARTFSFIGDLSAPLRLKEP